MIGKMIGALVGGKVAQNARGIGGPTGAVLGVVATTALRRISLPMMAVLGVGGYFAKKHFDKQQDGTKTLTTTGTGNTTGTGTFRKTGKSPSNFDRKPVGTTKATGEPVGA